MERATEYLKKNDTRLIFLLALLLRLLTYTLIPVDWNSDSYHHWLISYLTLHIGLARGRFWDLLGCDYYWGMIPHLVEAFLLWAFRTSSIEVFRIFNMLMGSVNAVLLYKVASRYYSWENAVLCGISFAVFPLAAVFDTIGMQDTIALSFILASLYLMRTHHFWSGICLGLACHSRVEYTIVSVLILAGFIMRERLFTDSQPYILGWLAAWGLPSLHIYTQTGNPIYPLYYSLYSVFGGYTSKFAGQPFPAVMSGWLGARLYIWTRSVFGVSIILIGLTGLLLIPFMAYRKWYRYEPQLYLVSSLMVLGPIFLPYFESGGTNLLLMIRFIIPAVALGLPIFFHFISKLRMFSGINSLVVYIQAGVIVLSLIGYPLIIPRYIELQATVINEYKVADRAGALYQGGSVVCDIPSMIYRLVEEWDLSPSNLLSNHYGPHYYAIHDPVDYIEWLQKEDIRLWMYYGDRGDPVWAMIEGNYQGVLVNLFGEPGYGCYSVDHGLIDSLL